MRVLSTILLICLGVLPVAGLAQVRCAPVAPVNGLLIHLDMLGPERGAVDLEHRQRLAAFLKRIDALPPSSLARMRADADVKVMLDTIMDRANQIVTSGLNTQPQSLQALLTGFWQANEALCEVQSTAELGNHTTKTIGHTVSVVPFADGVGPFIPVNIQMQRMGSLVAGLLAFAISLFVLEFGVKRALLLLFDRRSCLIGGLVVVDDHSHDGTVLRLSRDACLFRFEGARKIPSGAANLRVTLNIGEFRLKARIAFDDKEQIELRFVQRLNASTHRKLIERSAITAFYAPERKAVVNPDEAATRAAVTAKA